MKKLYFLLTAVVLLSAPAALWAQNVPQAQGGVTVKDYQLLPNPVGTTDAAVIIGNIIKGLLTIIGTLAILMVVYGGWLWLTALGNDSKITQGKDILTWTTIGLIIVFISYVVVKYVFELVGAGA